MKNSLEPDCNQYHRKCVVWRPIHTDNPEPLHLQGLELGCRKQLQLRKNILRQIIGTSRKKRSKAPRAWQDQAWCGVSRGIDFIFLSDDAVWPDNMTSIAARYCRESFSSIRLGETKAARTYQERVYSQDLPLTLRYYISCSNVIKEGGFPEMVLMPSRSSLKISSQYNLSCEHLALCPALIYPLTYQYISVVSHSMFHLADTSLLHLPPGGSLLYT